jgi:hypothetical protein
MRPLLLDLYRGLGGAAVGYHRAGELSEIKAAIGFDWTADRAQLVEAIPPAYTEYVGHHLLAAL